MGAVSRALLPSLGPQEFVEERSAIDGRTEFPVVTDSGPNNPRSHFLLPSRDSNPTSIYPDQMGVINCLMFDGPSIKHRRGLPSHTEVNSVGDSYNVGGARVDVVGIIVKL